MNLAKLIRDSFVFGIIGGAVSLVFFFYLFSALRSAVIYYTGNIYILRPPAVHLLAMIINMIFFRLLMINLKKEKTAKGLLLITFMATLAYFFIYFRLNK